MAKTKKQREAEQAKAIETIRKTAAVPGVLRIEWTSGRATATGRTDCYAVNYVTEEGRERTLTQEVAKAMGYRVNKQGAMSIAGLNYSKTHEIVQEVVRLVQHDLRVECPLLPEVVRYQGKTT